MSMITELIDRLRESADNPELDIECSLVCDGECNNLLREAADTIEELSAKLQAANMERSSNGGWISVKDRLPTKEEYIANNGLFIVSDGNRTYSEYFDVYSSMKYFGEPTMNGFRVDVCVIAWMPLPFAFKESEDKE